ncbi:aminomethyl-transferring glycine dehydrogenase subunit GcvPB [Sedimentibacter saalensis]|uniref:Glycine dehydrogenase subunit 2 n=1 Tax=Sedimentibacter saalensis TaxID=130788 RepID=A0A562JK80_9FIRM|nr:aminomethyl-transferring glycine dehydrogenase subunit GcvPB [Sedimentibacter saalensis]TWH83611.1 glycine dehydrogenase subunit 2 [Sedimentibacter saalensis]
MSKAYLRKNFHEACWDEPMIYELSTPGTRGILTPEVEEEIVALVGDASDLLPQNVQRKSPLLLPEVDQKHVLAHYIHLTQETMGSNVSNDLSEGTCTMKYNPRLCETLALNENFAYVHPDQDVDTIQGVLEIYYKFEHIMKEISGMDKFSFQPGGGNQAVYCAASVLRAYHNSRMDYKRDTIITTIFSHPCDAAAPATAGYKVITLYPDERGVPDYEALKKAVEETGDHLAGIFMTNPEDIGIYNPNIDKFADLVHSVGGLCYYDQANANAFLGVVRAREAGFDMCHFNIHKTFGTPHGGEGPACGAFGCREFLTKFLPKPTVEFNGEKYYLNYDMPDSFGKVREYFGVAGVILKAYSWAMMHGVEGMKECAAISVLNNNYLEKLLLSIKGCGEAFLGNGIKRQEQCRYSWEELYNDTGVGTNDINKRINDYGIPWYWASHHPWVIPEPMTLEPCETYSKCDLEEYYQALKQAAEEAYTNPEVVLTAPHKSASHDLANPEDLDDPTKWAITWRAFLRKHGDQYIKVK